MIKKINKDNLQKLVESWLGSGKSIVAPVRKGMKTVFSAVKKFDEIDLSYIQTVMSPKAVFFPSTEELLKYEREGGSYKVIEISEPQNEVILFGVKPCDAAGMNYLGEFFLRENTDKYIQLRKDKTTIVGLSCKTADEYCFCTSVGLSPSETKGSDILITDMGNEFYAEIITEKGESIYNENTSLFSDTPEVDKSKFTANPEKKFTIDDAVELAGKFDALFNSPAWVDESLACLGCGACAFSCPTCTCFDMQDEKFGNNGRRLRTWDTCGLGLFTLHASGHNPRHVQSERWRNRVMHKFDYSVKNIGEISCVGCGRCIRACPGGMNIADTFKRLTES